MIQLSEVGNVAVGLVGFRQPTKLGSVVLDSTLTASRSGLYFDSGSRLVTVENIVATMPDPDATDAQISDFLTNMVQDALMDVLNKVFGADDLLENQLLFTQESAWDTALDISDPAFVGYEINMQHHIDVSGIINRLLLGFNGVDSVKVLLFNSQAASAIQSATLSTVQDSTVEELVNWPLNPLQYGGKFYVGYLTSGLVADPLARSFETSNVQTQFLNANIRPIRVAGHASETMFDVNSIEYVSETWGLNFDFAAYRDHTQVILSNERRFAKALQLQFCADALNMIANTTRSNRSERLSKAAALLELDGNRNNPEVPTYIGLNAKLASEIKRLTDNYYPKLMQRLTLG